MSASISPDDRLQSSFLYNFAKTATGAPQGKRARGVLVGDASHATEVGGTVYVSNLPEEYTLSRVLELLKVIEGRVEETPFHTLVHPLKKACARLSDDEEDPPTLKHLFELCWGAEKYTPEKARNRLAALPAIFVPQPRSAGGRKRGGHETIVYRRPQGGDAEIVSFAKTINKLVRKAVTERHGTLSAAHLKGILKLTNNINTRQAIRVAVADASGMSTAAANKHYGFCLDKKTRCSVHEHLETLSRIDEEYAVLARCEDAEFLRQTGFAVDEKGELYAVDDDAAAAADDGNIHGLQAGAGGRGGEGDCTRGEERDSEGGSRSMGGGDRSMGGGLSGGTIERGVGRTEEPFPPSEEDDEDDASEDSVHEDLNVVERRMNETMERLIGSNDTTNIDYDDLEERLDAEAGIIVDDEDV